ncbi:MAG: B12-binding domain-containing radical SAM protein [Clostridiales bacterium]|jgi:radical SAM superfamily enzyme YgiQ (UPF0313 family)|nr:B12-binding domain-containing radical SAM protein [Clostridiales bacterium]
MRNPDILLINPPFHIRTGSGNFLPLGLGYIISAVNNEGLSAEVINCAEGCQSFFSDDLSVFETDIKNELHKYNPSLIGIGPCVTSHVRALIIIARVCKEVFPETPIVCGGPLATMNGQEWFFFEELQIPYIIKGDGEKAIPSLIKTIKNGLPLLTCPEVSYDGHFVYNDISDINSISFPHRLSSSHTQISDRRKSTKSGILTMPMITSRGCMYTCDYCVSGSLSSRFRKRSNDNILEEMIFLRDGYGATDIIFYDDCFFYNPKTSNEEIFSFCNLLMKNRLSMTWQIEMRTDLLLSLTDESLTLLEKSGCRQINIGIEKTSSESLFCIGKTSTIEGLMEKNKHIAKLFGIELTATFILGGFNENEKTVRKLIEDSKKLSLTQAHFNPLFVYPSTKLYNNYGLKARDWYNLIKNDTLPWGEIVFENTELSREKLLSFLDLAYTEFYGKTCINYTNQYLNRFNLWR